MPCATVPLTPSGQPANGSSLSTNQNGQLVTPSGQVLTLTPSGQFVTQNGLIVDQNGNPVSGVGQTQNQTGITVTQE
ncbi:hypothetical protein PCANC_22644 [Puccinia coronata f. sp. avenae]|uniref:Uncharacterized protein n=1 Tax=Puccinia coronata f. sp. avenae TaxID=200324 RepID=A0A2N5SBS9_9BASI|nr:hypothetical protein PCANC_22645 [Puccinia coronata f. sp. avenae]PLW10679.1 hypothetical protein PCANC_22644 [Puccinia coronata f. sp. avenae]